MSNDLKKKGSLNGFADYGENVFLLVQNAVIIGLMWKYNRSSLIEMSLVSASFVAFSVWGYGLPTECGPVGACTKVVVLSSRENEKYMPTVSMEPSDLFSVCCCTLFTMDLHHQALGDLLGSSSGAAAAAAADPRALCMEVAHTTTTTTMCLLLFFIHSTNDDCD